MTGYPAKPKSLSWSAKGRFLASSGTNAAILWPFHFKDGPMGRQPLQLGMRDAQATRVACHPRDEIVAIGYQDGTVMAVRFADNNEVPVPPRRSQPGLGAALGQARRAPRLRLRERRRGHCHHRRLNLSQGTEEPAVATFLPRYGQARVTGRPDWRAKVSRHSGG